MIAVLVIVAAVVVIGLLRSTFLNQQLFDGFWYVFGLAIAEPLGIVYLWAKNILGLREPAGKRITATTQEEINEYMKDFIASGTIVDIVSGRLSWVSGYRDVEEAIVSHSYLTIYLPSENDIATKLRHRGVNVRISSLLAGGPKARFTLLNKDRPGAGVLAVGTGILPIFEIAEYPESRYPLIVALARDYISTLVASAGA